tara:strand:- start:564 stop:1169 length:606 start_codon:yes stop_codon:yes gene_type:complete
MSITTYAELKTAVTSWLDVPTSTFTNQIDDLVTIAESRIFREARTKDTEASISTALSSGVYALPSDYLEMKFAYINSSPISSLERRSAEWIYTEYPLRTSSGIPKFFARESTNLIFGPYPDSDYTLKGVYYKKLTALSSGVQALFTNNPDLYLFATLAESEILIGRDDRIKLWEMKYQKILSDVNGLDRKENSSGSVLRMR